MEDTGVNDLPVLSRLRVSDKVYQVLRERILNHHWAFGQRLDLQRIEESMGISRTPLKEALSRLEMEGLVQIEPRRGTFVTTPTCEEVGESFDVRGVLDTYAAELAVPRVTSEQLNELRRVVGDLEELVDDQDWDQIYQEYLWLDNKLHGMLVDIAGNSRLKETWIHVNLYSHMASVHYGRTRSDVDVSLTQHREMLRLLEAKDAEGLKRIASDHVLRSKNWLLHEIAKRSKQGDNGRQADSGSVASGPPTNPEPRNQCPF